jgi:diguanylate cyclase (GGDEF)-like protein
MRLKGEDIIRKIIAGVDSRSKTAYVLAGLLLSCGILLLDTFTPYEVNLTFLYPVPILLVTIAAGTRAGVVLSAVCAVLITLTDVYGGRQFSRSIFLVADILATALSFSFFAYLVGMLCSTLRREVLFSRTDELTGLANRQQFLEFAAQEMERCRLTGNPFNLLAIDCNDFKTINDTLGVQGGDKMLKAIARTIAGSARSIDCACRLGSDRFALVLPCLDRVGTLELADNLRQELAEAVRAIKQDLDFNIGVVSGEPFADEPEQILDGMEQAMRAAKKIGQTMVIFPVAPDQAGA